MIIVYNTGKILAFVLSGEQNGLPHTTFIQFPVANDAKNTLQFILIAKSHRNSYSNRKPVPKRACRCLNPWYLVPIRMSAQAAIKVAKSIQLTHGKKSPIR